MTDHQHAPLTPEGRAALHAHLQQQRENADALSPKIKPGTKLADALSRASITPEGLSPLPTREHLAEWQIDPAGLTDELHTRFCAGGMIEVRADNGHTAAHPCPRCVALRRTNALRDRLTKSGVPLRYMDITWDDLDASAPPFPALRRAMQEMGQVIGSNDSLALIGPPGSGKTQVAVLAAKAADAAGHSALVVNLGRLALDVRESYRGAGLGTTEYAALQELIKPELLILDDLGAGETDTAAVERRLLYLALEDRQNARRPCIVTTNLSAPELAAYLGARNLGRLQPLEIVEMRHGRNFRLHEGRKSTWNA